jgi:hypothetical protein
VYATVEIKTTLRLQDVEDIAESSRSVKQLWYHPEQIMSLRQSDGGLDFWAQKASSPMTFFVAYDSDYATLEGLCNAVLNKLNGLPETERPTAGIVINAGMTFMHRQVPIPRIGEKMRAGVFLLLQEGHEQEGIPMQLDGDFTGPYIHNGFHYPVYKHSGHNRPVDPPRAFLSFLLSLLNTLDSKKLTQRPFYTDYVPRHYSSFHAIE